MKIIDRYLLSSFVKPFIATFVVMEFFLLMQFVWKYVDDLVGRGVEWYYIVELLFYMSAGVFPMALPISVLLSSIMTMGNLSEHYELAAIKSGGVSLLRTLRPLMFAIVVLAGAAFYFYNNVIPVANFKSENLLRNIARQKPAFNIQQGVFYSGIEDYIIRIGRKHGEKGNLLEEVYVYDLTEKKGNLKVTTAKRGKMEFSDDDEWLIMTLYDGFSYEDVIPSARKEREKRPFIKSEFSESQVRFSLLSFQPGNLREDEDGHIDHSMLSIDQLMSSVDSLHVVYENRWGSYTNTMNAKYNFASPEDVEQRQPQIAPKNIQNTVVPTYQLRMYENARRLARANLEYAESMKMEMNWRQRVIARYYIEWHKKFALSFMCIVLFLIGAPLGAIIRKGGMGMPVVISVFIFIFYHVLTITFEKLGKELILQPWASVWISSAILLPVGIFLTYKSAKDSSVLDAETYLRPFEWLGNLLKKFRKKKKDEGTAPHQ